MTYTLFLDDEREPSLALLARDQNVIVSRNFTDAKDVVLRRGMPAHVCFDHDLGDDSLTGHDFAKWLVDHALDQPSPPEIKYSVHSQNPVGAANIRGTIDNYNKYRSNLK